MKTKNLILLISCLLLGCKVDNSQSGTEKLPVFDFTMDYPQKKMCLQDMAEIEYVRLETSNDILLGGMIGLSAISDKYILMHESRLGDIFVFDRTGKLYSHFNHTGQSGQEYVWIKNGTLLDEEKEEIYVCAQVIQVYSLKGEYKRTLRINGFENDMKILNFDNKSLLIYDEVVIEPGREDKTKKTPYRLVSKEDGSLISNLNIHFPKRYSNAMAQHLEDNMWRPFKWYYPHNMHYGTDLIIADISSDTLFQLSPDKGLIPLLTRKPSVHASEPRNIWTPYLTIDRFMLFGTILLDFNSKGGKMPTFIYDFNTGEINKASIVDTEFETKSWSQGQWSPDASTAIARNMAAEMIQPPAMIEAYHGKRLKGNGEKIAKSLREDDNPVVRIIKFRQ